MNNKLPIVVSFAGTDPSGGAGMQADIKAISATGAYAASIITALVAQNTCGVQAIEHVSIDFVHTQAQSVFSDLKVSAVKIGMLHHEAMIEAVFAELAHWKPRHVVIDPVMVAKGGALLLDLSSIDVLKKKLVSAVSLMTPNIPEAEYLLNDKIDSVADMATAAQKLGQLFHINVLVKGGHLNGEQSSDVLYLHDHDDWHWFHSPRVQTQNTHGTGCSLSSAVASYLAQDYPLINAIVRAKDYLTRALESGAQYTIGAGHGPVDHFYYLRKGQI